MSILRRILNRQREQLLADERQWLGRLQVVLGRFDLEPEQLAVLERSIHQLDQLFLLVVVGEFNAGKSAFINALLGSRVLEEGVTPTTTRIQIIRHGDEPEHAVAEALVDVIKAPVELLREINIVDTPGTNAIYREHERITSDFVPRSDLVLFVTSADRPFTESERTFLQSIREWGKKVIVVINKIDILERPEDVARVEEFVLNSAQSLIGSKPQVFPIAARRALREKLNEPGAERPPSDRFAELEQYIASTLDQQERIKLKLMNPLGVGQHLIGQSLTVIESRLELLQDDVHTLEDIDRELEMYRKDLLREFGLRLSQVDGILHEFENRGVEFFDDTLRVTRAFDLLNKSRLKAEFERKVVADTPQRIERAVHDAIDWMVASDLRQWQAVMSRLEQRKAAHADRIVGEVGGTFSYDRARLLDSVGGAADRAIRSYDHDREASQMAESVRMAVAGAALAEAGAISLGAAVSVLATTTFADVTGILAAGTVAVLGLFVIPVRRQRAKQELRDKIAQMRERLMVPLRTQFEREVDRNLERIRESIAPYTRFVRGERERLAGLQRELSAVRNGLDALRVEIERAS